MNRSPLPLPTPAEPAFDARGFRDAMGSFASGITVVTGMADGSPAGFTCQSFVSVSLDPPLVSFCVMDSSRSWPSLRGADGLCIHMLAAPQQALSNAFAARDGDRWHGVDWRRAGNGAPMLPSALLVLECQLHAEIDAGDHRLVLCRVTALHRPETSEDPLLFYRGRYRHLAEPAQQAS